MIDDLSSISEEERCLFRPFTRESLIAIQARIAEELEKQKELEKRRADGEVSHFLQVFFIKVYLSGLIFLIVREGKFMLILII